MPTARSIGRITALLLLPFLVMLGGVEAHALYRCAGDSVARRTCCCPKAHAQPAERTGAPQSVVRAACCCSIERVAATDAPSAQPQDRDAAAAAQACPVVFAVVVPAPIVAASVSRVPHPHRQLAPPRTTASLFSQHIALLV